jgi:hypothetical protein
MAEITVTITAMCKCIGHTIMATIIMLGQGIIIQIHATTDTIETTTIIIDILTKIRVRKTTTGLIRIAETKAEVGVEEAGKFFLDTNFTNNTNLIRVIREIRVNFFLIEIRV